MADLGRDRRRRRRRAARSSLWGARSALAVPVLLGRAAHGVFVLLFDDETRIGRG
jgi:hypothetical protein